MSFQVIDATPCGHLIRYTFTPRWVSLSAGADRSRFGRVLIARPSLVGVQRGAAPATKRLTGEEKALQMPGVRGRNSQAAWVRSSNNQCPLVSVGTWQQQQLPAFHQICDVLGHIEVTFNSGFIEWATRHVVCQADADEPR